MDFLEKNSFIDSSRKESYPTVQLSNFAGITSYDIFDGLSFWNKLEFVRKAVDLKILQDIYDKSASKQLQAEALFRIYKLGE